MQHKLAAELSLLFTLSRHQLKATSKEALINEERTAADVCSICLAVRRNLCIFSSLADCIHTVGRCADCAQIVLRVLL